MLPPDTTKEFSFIDNRTKAPDLYHRKSNLLHHKPKGIHQSDHNQQDNGIILNKSAPISYHTTLYLSATTRNIAIIHPYHGILLKNTINRGKQQQQQQKQETANKKRTHIARPHPTEPPMTQEPKQQQKGKVIVRETSPKKRKLNKNQGHHCHRHQVQPYQQHHMKRKIGKKQTVPAQNTLPEEDGKKAFDTHTYLVYVHS
eukprot:15336270-Ditylum_brightwellii.AAC.1